MYDVRQTARFRTWLLRVRDPVLKGRLIRRIERLAAGHPGDHRFLGGGLYELREHAGPGYRLYYTIQFGTRVLLIGGGDKSSQSRDIEIARSVMAELEEDE